MGARYNVTNKAKGPRGFREEGKAHPTTVQVGETATLIVDAAVEQRLLELQEFGLVTLSRLADLSDDPATNGPASQETPSAPAPAPASDDPEPSAEEIAAAVVERDRLAKEAAEQTAETDRKNAEEAAEKARADAEALRQSEAEDDEPEFTDEQIESWKPELLRSYITEKTGEAPAASCNTKTLINKAKAAAAPKAPAPAPEEAV